MNRFPPHYHENKEQPLCCFTCEQPLTETEADHYWNSHLHGEGEPYCFDCASQLEIEPVEVATARPHSLLTIALFYSSLGCVLSAILFPEKAGYAILLAVGSANLGILARVCRL